MKKITVSATILLASLNAASALAATPALMSVPVTHVYAPLGFDSNDNTEVVVSGYLPNLCYKSPRTETKITGKNVAVTMTALNSGGMYCLQTIVPFIEVASLGVLDKGKYNIDVNTGTPTHKNSSIGITESTSPAIDDHIYANVSYVEKAPGSRKVILKGENPTSCFALDHIEMISNGSDTYSVLPILKQVSQICPQMVVPFAYETDVPKGLSEDEILLHVRIMNGKSVNTLFDNTIE